MHFGIKFLSKMYQSGCIPAWFKFLPSFFLFMLICTTDDKLCLGWANGGKSKFTRSIETANCFNWVNWDPICITESSDGLNYDPKRIEGPFLVHISWNWSRWKGYLRKCRKSNISSLCHVAIIQLMRDDCAGKWWKPNDFSWNSNL